MSRQVITLNMKAARRRFGRRPRCSRLDDCRKSAVADIMAASVLVGGVAFAAQMADTPGMATQSHEHHRAHW